VVVVDPADGGAPPAYRTQVGVTRTHFGPDDSDPDDLAALRHYYPHLYDALDLEGAAGRAAYITRGRRAADFLAVAEGPLPDSGSGPRDRRKAFRMVDDDSVPVLVTGYGSAAERRRVTEVAEALRLAETPDGRLLRGLQSYLASMRRRLRDRADVAALCLPVLGDLVEWRGKYDKTTGLVVDLEAEDFLA
jgi:CRISPR-associated endonuclease/helicase Cas3